MCISNHWKQYFKRLLGLFLTKIILQRIIPFPTSSCQKDVWIGMILSNIGFHVLYLNLFYKQMVRYSRQYIKVGRLRKLLNIKMTTKKKWNTSVEKNIWHYFLSMGHIDRLLNIIQNDDEPIKSKSSVEKILTYLYVNYVDTMIHTYLQYCFLIPFFYTYFQSFHVQLFRFSVELWFFNALL